MRQRGAAMRCAQACVRAIPAVVFGVLLTAPGHAARSIACRANEAVYEAIQKAPGAAPDQLRFQYDPPGQGGLPNIMIKSFEKRQEIVFLAAITNGSGVISVVGYVPFEKLPRAMQENHRSMHVYYVQNPERYQQSFGLDYK